MTLHMTLGVDHGGHVRRAHPAASGVAAAKVASEVDGPDLGTPPMGGHAERTGQCTFVRTGHATAGRLPGGGRASERGSPWEMEQDALYEEVT